MRLQVTGDFDAVERDMRKAATSTRRKVAQATAKNARAGNRLAAKIAKESAGAHGKHYHKAFSAEPITPLIWEYGPDAGKKQGGMSFNEGSRNQPAHNDLEKSMDVQVPKWREDVRDAMKDLL